MLRSLVGSEMCIRDRFMVLWVELDAALAIAGFEPSIGLSDTFRPPGGAAVPLSEVAHVDDGMSENETIGASEEMEALEMIRKTNKSRMEAAVAAAAEDVPCEACDAEEGLRQAVEARDFEAIRHRAEECLPWKHLASMWALINCAYDLMFELRPEEAALVSKLKFKGYPLYGIKIYLSLMGLNLSELELLNKYKVLLLTAKHQITLPSDPNALRRGKIMKLKPERCQQLLSEKKIVREIGSDGVPVFKAEDSCWFA
eukprot:TRINITY_DN19360_c0_g1_i1.p1 TRINITY_DN19360_c0_g1~~TRINITY_DN19360_c0_g1_i1.p1  ORF type:complete len:257 (+),score=80.79 TRINITY_DN19360_c0_g1_i1:88-858(+)